MLHCFTPSLLIPGISETVKQWNTKIKIFFGSILNKHVSYYPSINASTEGILISLLTLLQSEKHKFAIEALRKEPDLNLQKQLKLQLPCFTVAGIFERRANESLVQSSGLAAVDLDSAEDYDAIQVMHELKKIPYIAYCGLSCRGKRLFCIIPFLFPDQYTRQYSSLIKSFEAIGLPMGDNCHKVISQPRFVSYNTDETQFFNHSAKRFHLLEPEKIYHYTQSTNRETKTGKPENAFLWCANQINKSHSFSENSRHAYILHLARYCNLKGIYEIDALKGCSNFKSPDFKENEIISIVKHVYTHHKNSFRKYPFTE